MSNTAERTPSDLSAKELVQAIGREVLDRYFPRNREGGKEANHAFAIMQEAAQRIYALEAALRKPQVTPEGAPWFQIACPGCALWFHYQARSGEPTPIFCNACMGGVSAQRGGSE